ncbi:MAG TPA: metal-dependent hydrolase [Chitinophagaceae bacterium]|nr:metal-dependent hydrolase [Chitinophagaceae bacterium]
MDSVTHIILGAAIGEALLGKRIGRKAALIGALAKSLPDFDLFYTGLNDPRLYMCCHRGHTHSLFWESLYAIPLAWLFFALFRKKIPLKHWLLLFWICLFGHSLLDTCTNFGTRLFLPFTNHAFNWNTMAIADVCFTIPMLLLWIASLIAPNASLWRRRLNNSILIYAFSYLGLTLLNKYSADRITRASLKAQHIPYQQYMTNPTILNNILWYGLASNDSMIYIGEFSLLKKNPTIHWLSFPRNRVWLNEHPDTSDTKMLKWFSKGYDITQKDGDTLNVYCVKFGRTNMKEKDLEKTFIFHYKLFRKDNQWQMGMEEPNEGNANLKEGFIDLLNRIQGKE